MSEQVRVNAVPQTGGARASAHRRMLVGPGHNQPEPFPGYTGFVGWASPCLLRNGDMLVTFSAGYWHASPPTPLVGDPDTIREWARIGMPQNLEAPTGGRAMIMRSTDRGRTFSRPETLIDTPADDRHPSVIELADGTLLCSFFAYTGPHDRCGTHVVRSFDGGQTWEKDACKLPSPMGWDGTDGAWAQMEDGSVLLAVYGGVESVGGMSHIGLFRTKDSGETWEMVSVVKCEHEMSEPGLALLPDGRLVLMTRPEGDIAWSEDGGETWSSPVSFGMRMYEPGLLVTQDGTLVCTFGTYNGHDGISGLHVILSRDGGETWAAPAADYGFTLDGSVYGYGRGVLLPDGSIYTTYLDNGAFTVEQVARESIWAVRFRIREDGRGIETLPPEW